MTRRPQKPTDGRRKGGKGRGAKTAAGRAANRVSESKTYTGQLKPKQSPEAASAEFMVEGVGTNAATAESYSKMLGELDLAECMAALVAQTRKVQAGNLAGLEALLTAQAVILNAMFTQLGSQASKMTIVDQIDRFGSLKPGPTRANTRFHCGALALNGRSPVASSSYSTGHRGRRSISY